MAGFSTGEACFFILTQKSATKSGTAVSSRFCIGQHTRDIGLMESLVEYFNCGYVASNGSVCWRKLYIVTRNQDIVEKILPFYDKYPIRGSKFKNYLDFKEAVEIIKNKEHLDMDGKGLERILQIKGSGHVSGVLLSLLLPNSGKLLKLTVPNWV